MRFNDSVMRASGLALCVHTSSPISISLHYSPLRHIAPQWGGLIDTRKLVKQQVTIDQPRGGFEYEPMRSYQYTVKDMYVVCGNRQRNSNGGRNISLRRLHDEIKTKIYS